MISIKVKQLKTLEEKSKGLIGESTIYNIYFKTRFGIHTFGLKFPIDVVILDKTNSVKKLKQTLQPNKIFLWNPLYDGVLELENGTIQKTKIKMGDTIFIDVQH